MQYSVEREIGGKTLVIETGKYANQANGAVLIRRGETMLLATVCLSGRPRPDIDFLPLTVDYEERLYAAGRIPGSFFRREGRPTQEAILFGRLTDRPLRPLFPKGLRNDVQIILTVLSVDKENPPEILGIVGASAALSISDIPFDGPVGASRVSHADTSYVINPTYKEINDGELSVVVAGTRDAVMMVEAEAQEASEEVVLEAIRRAQEANGQVIDMIQEMVTAVGKPKIALGPAESDLDLEAEIGAALDGKLSRALEAGGDKAQQEDALGALEAEVRERFDQQYPAQAIAGTFESIVKRETRSRILDKGIRPDGRSTTEIRPISCGVEILPRAHGSGLFTRGETQVLSIATLASIGMKQKLDSLSPEETKRFMHHYNFSPFSVGEVKRLGTGRREVGHGALAERALLSAIPSEEDFPYAIRLVSEVLSSNGSTSMASVCASTLALMDAGVPMKSPVAGVAMGLVMGEDGRYSVLTDIAGVEDHLGDMDFKVAGTAQGINALQMDIKLKGITYEVMEQALKQAREGRLFILDKMREAIAEPRAQVSPHAPKMLRMVIPVDKIGALIGPGGKTIRAIQEDTGVNIDTEDDGTVLISGLDSESMEKARARVDGLTREIRIGDIFTGRVMRVTNFGAFVQLVPGKDGLIRLEDLGSDLGEDGLEMGLELTVMVQEIDHMGRINLSRRALFDGPEGQAAPAARPSRPPYAQPRQGGPPPGARGGGPGDSRRPPPRQGGARPPSGPGRRPSPGPPSFRDSDR